MERYLMVIFYSFLVLAFLFLAKKIADALTKYNDDDAVEQNGNMAVALRRLGLYVGMAIAMAGVMTGGSTKMELVLFIQDGAIATVIFFLAHYINDYAIISGVRNNDLIKAGNVPTGLVEAGSFIATGILLNGAFTGEVGGLLPAIVSDFIQPDPPSEYCRKFHGLVGQHRVFLLVGADGHDRPDRI
ncbi:MAG: DUF350 domain-containing protein [Deltaproteobacteria bacterium]|nr:DUF350 domain-containing protein [Deltaproteobacteria bacterium]